MFRHKQRICNREYKSGICTQKKRSVFYWGYYVLHQQNQVSLVVYINTIFKYGKYQPLNRQATPLPCFD